LRPRSKVLPRIRSSHLGSLRPARGSTRGGSSDRCDANPDCIPDRASCMQERYDRRIARKSSQCSEEMFRARGISERQMGFQSLRARARACGSCADIERRERRFMRGTMARGVVPPMIRYRQRVFRCSSSSASPAKFASAAGEVARRKYASRGESRARNDIPKYLRTRYQSGGIRVYITRTLNHTTRLDSVRSLKPNSL